MLIIIIITLVMDAKEIANCTGKHHYYQDDRQHHIMVATIITTTITIITSLITKKNGHGDPQLHW